MKSLKALVMNKIAVMKLGNNKICNITNDDDNNDNYDDEIYVPMKFSRVYDGIDNYNIQNCQFYRNNSVVSHFRVKVIQGKINHLAT